jgi:hypothetical protein
MHMSAACDTRFLPQVIAITTGAFAHRSDTGWAQGNQQIGHGVYVSAIVGQAVS